MRQPQSSQYGPTGINPTVDGLLQAEFDAREPANIGGKAFGRLPPEMMPGMQPSEVNLPDLSGLFGSPVPLDGLMGETPIAKTPLMRQQDVKQHEFMQYIREAVASGYLTAEQAQMAMLEWLKRNR